MNEQGHRLAALQLGLHLAEVIFTVHRLAVDFQDHVAALQAQVFVGEGAVLHVLHDHAFARRRAQSAGNIGCEIAHAQAQLRFRGRRGFRPAFVLAQQITVKLGAVGDSDRRLLRFAIAQERERSFTARLESRNFAHQLVALFHRLAVYAGDGVTLLDASLVGRSAGAHVGDDDARLHAVYLRQSGVGLRVEFNSDGAARNPVIGADELVVNLGGDIRRQSEAHAFVSRAFGEDGSVDADDFAAHVDQRPAGVAGIDGRVSLNHGLELALRHDIAAGGGDDAGSHCGIQPEGAADSQHPIAYLHGVGVAKLGAGQLALAVDLDYREIGFAIHADDFGIVQHALRLVLQLHADAVGPLHHVVVGQDVAARIHDDSGTQRALTHAFRRLRAVGAAAEEAVKKILERVAIAIVVALRSAATAPVGGRLDGGLRINIHHRRLHLLGDARKGNGKLLRRGHLQRGGIGGEVGVFLALYLARNNRSDQDSYCQSQRTSKSRKIAARLDALQPATRLWFHSHTSSQMSVKEIIAFGLFDECTIGIDSLV